MKLLERDIQKACEDLLALDGWRILRFERTKNEHSGRPFGEVGMPDTLALRYDDGGILWVEWKRPRGKVSKQQKAWHMKERRYGAETWIAGADFPPTIEGFWAHYAKSGLMRRELKVL